MAQHSVLITGCSSGIGYALALEFKRRGWQVIATARRPEALQKLIKENFITEKLDVTSFDEIEQVCQKISTRHGALDMVINNAGYGLIAPIMEVTPQEMLRQLQTNTAAPLEIARHCAVPMKEKGRGIIVNIGSVSGILTTPFSGAYCASKAALHALSDALRMELAPFGIKVISVQPGGVQSAFAEHAALKLNHLFTEHSWYQPIREFVLNRVNASQENAMPAVEFARQLVNELEKPDPKPIIRLGSKSKLLPFLKWALPVSSLDRILMKKFGLRELEKRLKGRLRVKGEGEG